MDVTVDTMPTNKDDRTARTARYAPTHVPAYGSHQETTADHRQGRVPNQRGRRRSEADQSRCAREPAVIGWPNRHRCNARTRIGPADKIRMMVRQNHRGGRLLVEQPKSRCSAGSSADQSRNTADRRRGTRYACSRQATVLSAPCVRTATRKSMPAPPARCANSGPSNARAASARLPSFCSDITLGGVMAASPDSRCWIIIAMSTHCRVQFARPHARLFDWEAYASKTSSRMHGANAESISPISRKSSATTRSPDRSGIARTAVVRRGAVASPR